MTTTSTSAIPSYATFQAGNLLVKLKGEFIAVYSDNNIATLTGISQLTGPPTDGAQTVSLQGAISSGVLRRAKVRLKTKKIRDLYFVAANTNKVGALIGAAYGANTISSAYFPRRFTLG